jgi:phage shock protein A
VAVEDMIIPMLREMRAELGALRGKVDDIAETVVATREELADLKAFVTFHVGRTTETEAIVDGLRKDVADLKRPIATLESRS